MKITGSNLLLAIIVGSLLLVSITSATYNVTPMTTGDTSITWVWDSGLDLEAMYLNGQLLCGYETTQPFVNIIGLQTCTNYNLTIVYNGTSGTDISSTTCGGGNVTGGSSYGGGGEAVGAVTGLVGGLIGALLIVRRYVKP
jgi:hypothetical protein